jgi:hypothetical protein
MSRFSMTRTLSDFPLLIGEMLRRGNLRWGGEGLGNQQRQNRGRVSIEKVDFTFSPSSIHKKKGPPFSWHLRTEEQAEIDHAWTSIRNWRANSESIGVPGTRKK